MLAGKTANLEIGTLFQEWDRIANQADPRRMLIAGETASQTALGSAKAKVDELGTTLLNHIRKARMMGRVKPLFKSSKRQPSAKGKDLIVSAAQKRGATFRAARRGITVVFETWSRLLASGEPVETPIGILYRRLAHSEPGERWKIVLKRNKLLSLDTDQARISPMPPTAPVRSTNLTCEHCGGSHFVAAEFAQYWNGYSAHVGAGLQRVSDVITALVCLCGAPVARPVRQNYVMKDPDSFPESLRRAIGSRQTILQKLKEEFASKGAVQEVLDRVSSLEQAIKVLTEVAPRGRPKKN
jgi:hypothetical protein